jgi:methionyl-tRNA formyltransferase
MIVTILTDQSDSWFVQYGYQLLELLNRIESVSASYVFDQEDIPENNGILFMLSCVKLVSDETLIKSDSNIVIHASDLPKGKGFSPLQWQIREGNKSIVLTLFEAVKNVDAGDVYSKVTLSFTGTELLTDLRKKMALKIVEMCLNYSLNFSEIQSQPQTGEETFYRKLNAEDDELDINKTIFELMDQLRSSDFEKFPPYFYYQGKKFYMRLQSDE